MIGIGGSQHDEDSLLQKIFRNQPNGFVVDVGAADGMDNSNTWLLLQRPGWGGILIEPELSQFRELDKLYKDRDGVTCVNNAVGKYEGEREMWCGLQVSTFIPSVKQNAEKNYGVNYSSAKVQMAPLTVILLRSLKPGHVIDFMSIDAEGMDREIWETLRLDLFLPKLFCMEGTKHSPVPGYREYCQVGCNTFYMREDCVNNC